MKTNENQNVFAPITLDSLEQVEADKVRSKYPKALAAIHQFKDAYAVHVDKYRTLCEVLRTENLAPRELTILFLSEGVSKVRASEFRKIVDLPPEQYERFQKGLISFRAALVSGRGGAIGGNDNVAASSQLPHSLQSAFAALVNAADTSTITRKKVVARLERLDCVFQLTVKRVRVAKKSGRKKGKKAKRPKQTRAALKVAAAQKLRDSALTPQ